MTLEQLAKEVMQLENSAMVYTIITIFGHM